MLGQLEDIQVHGGQEENFGGVLGLVKVGLVVFEVFIANEVILVELEVVGFGLVVDVPGLKHAFV